jgi:hypothetical protein
MSDESSENDDDEESSEVTETTKASSQDEVAPVEDVDDVQKKGLFSWLRKRAWFRATERNRRKIDDLESAVAQTQRMFLDFHGQLQDEIRANKARNLATIAIARGAATDVIGLKKEMDLVRLDFRALQRSSAFTDQDALASTRTERDELKRAHDHAAKRVEKLERAVTQQQDTTARLLSDLELLDQSHHKRLENLRRAWRSVIQEDIAVAKAKRTGDKVSLRRRHEKRSSSKRGTPRVFPEVAAQPENHVTLSLAEKAARAKAEKLAASIAMNP